MAYEINVALVGITIVFFALLFLAFIIFGSSKVLSFKKPKNNDDEITITPRVRNSMEEDTQATDNSGNDLYDEELVAVLTAAVLSYMKDKTTDSKIRIKSYRRIPQTSPVWNITGRIEQINT
jgi:glutaconyl-CoA/methylmalonyl-CoA decarboxylase subunit delta